ncbi:MAG: type II toxin-antitoxin system VapC family toxin [Alphaproteobacteria bacterium]|nr:type II toxin-antitoxin system VapC family toxin [Alphaproteobacteria bacterium]
MVIDTSALLAILFDEPERRRFNELIEADGTRLISAASFVESTMVMEMRRHEAGSRGLEAFLKCADVTVMPVDVEQAHAANRAFRWFGKGRHPARLTFGDCFAYALAITTGEPLLFKGGDFALTDIVVA